MKPHSSRPMIAVRPSRFLMWLVPLAAAVAISGCNHHKRTAMRPVYVSPAPVIAPAVEACPGGPCPTAGTGAGFSDGSTLTGPVASPPSGPATPARPKMDDVTPQSGSEPTYQPNLQPNPAASGESPPPMTGPNARRTTNRRSALGPARSGDSLRQKVAAFVDQPNDVFLPPKADRAWRYIVVHHSDHATGSYAQIDKDHRDQLGTKGCGYHFVIGNGSESADGKVEVAERWLDQKAGAHCRDSTISDTNDYGIGICLIGDLDEAAPTSKQVEATQALIAYLRDRYEIPADRVVAHSAVAQTPTTCPGSKFTMDSVRGSRVALRDQSETE